MMLPLTFIPIVIVWGALVGFFVWLLVRGLKRGVVNGRGVTVSRSTQPFGFWSAILMNGAVAAIVFLAPIYLWWTMR